MFIEFIAAKTNDIKVQRLVREIGSAVSDAVAAMNQTYVNDLKTAGTFKEARTEGSTYEGRVRRAEKHEQRRAGLHQ